MSHQKSDPWYIEYLCQPPRGNTKAKVNKRLKHPHSQQDPNQSRKLKRVEEASFINNHRKQTKEKLIPIKGQLYPFMLQTVQKMQKGPLP